MAVLIKRSAVSGKVPTTSSMNLGELAMNTTDGRLFMMANSGGGNAIVEITSVTSLDNIPVTATAMTLTGLQYANAMLVFSGTLTGNTVITVPNTPHAFIVVNKTTGNYSLTIASAGMTPSVNIVQGAAESLLCDTTGVYATASTTGVEFSKVIPVTGNVTADITYAGAMLLVTTPGVTITLPLANSYPAGAGFGILNISGGNATVVTQGGNTSELGLPLTVYPNDSYYLAADNSTKWHCMWYSNPLSPTFSSANILNTLSVGTTLNVGTTLTVTGTSNLNGGCTVTGTLNAGNVNATDFMSVKNVANNTVLGIEAASYAGGAVLEAYNIANTVKKNIALVPWGGRLLVATVTDDGSNVFQTVGNAAIGNNGAASQLTLRSTLGTSGTPTVTTNTTIVSSIVMSGFDGANYQTGAQINAVAEGTYSSTSAPTNIRFLTSPSGAITPSERMRITAAGQVLIGQTSNDGASALQVGGATVINSTLSVGGNITSTVGKIQAQNSTGAFTATNGGGTGQTSIILSRTGAATDQKQWEEIVGSDGSFAIRTVNDAYSAAQYAIQITRAATSYNLGYMTLMPTGGHVLVGGSTDNGVDEVQVTGSVQSTVGFRFPDGTLQTTANGVTAPISTVYTPAAAATFITTGGYSVGFAQVFKNNLRLIPNVDFTATDGVTVQLTTAATGRDRYEVLTGVIYSPSTVFQPTSAVFNVTAGQSTITTNYSVGCVWVFQNNDKLVPIQDYTATNGTSITLTNASTSSTDQYEVVSFTPFAVNGMLPLAGGTMTGALVVNSSITSTSTYMNAAAGVARINTYETSGVTRWVEGVSSDAETGSNAGSNWYLARSSDAGAWIDNPLYVSRQSGLVSLSQGLIMPDGYTVQNTGMGRNRIINGDGRVAQRVNGVYATTAFGYGGPDRWWAANSSGGGQFTQAPGTMTIGSVVRPCITQTVNTAWSTFTTTNYWSGFMQRIEATNCYDMVGAPAALSFWFNTNVTGTFCAALQDSTQTHSYVMSFSATSGTPVKVSIPIAALPTAFVTGGNVNTVGAFLWIGFINGTAGTYTNATTNAWLSGNYITSPSATNWAATAGNFIQVTDVQLESATNATPFDRKSFQTSYLECLRYYEQMNQGNYGCGSQNGATISYAMVTFQGPKRAAPSVTGSAAGTFYLYNGLGNLVVTAMTWPTVTIREALASVSHGSSGAAGGSVILEDYSSSWIGFISEL